MSYYDERILMIEKAAQDAAKIDGYKVFRQTNPDYHYFFVITPSDNVLCVCLDVFFRNVCKF